MKIFSITQDPSQVQKWIRSQRGYLQFNITFSENRNTGVIERWTVFSLGKRSTLVRYLFGKWLWDELSSEELKVFLTLPEVLDDYYIFTCYKLVKTNIPKKIIRKRLENISKLMKTPYLSQQQYKSISSQSNFLLLEKKSRLAKVPKYSGYTKHYKDKGNLPREKTFLPSEISEFEEFDISKEIFLLYLTVGKILLPASGEVILP